MSSLERKDKRVNGLMSVGTRLYGMTHHNFGRGSRLHGNDGGEGTCETGFRRERGVLFAYSVRFSNNRQALVKTAVPRLDATI